MPPRVILRAKAWKTGPRVKTLFFGTSDFAVPSLRVLAAKTELAGVVTQPDRRSGRGHKLQPTPVKSTARELNLRVFEPTGLRSFSAQLADEGYELFVLASYGKILPQSLLDLPKYGALNVHPSLLPQYRGATPIQSALKDGRSQTGVTLMLMDAGMDTGEVVLQEMTQIGSEENYGDLHERLASMGGRLLGDAVDQLARGPLVHHPQIGESSVTRPVSAPDIQIDWNWRAEQIVNHIRAFSPKPAARAFLGGVPVKILRAAVSVTSLHDPDCEKFKPGEITASAGDDVAVKTGEGAVAIQELIAPNRGPVSGAAFARSIAASRQ
ncbi:MAG: methionyl-tRNA formyltransferase [Candidatus Eremiobacteraeota bacterium]|nr:methionyl-tRNA formyltransferase [Candidatus Eremiobacteraeota bacterium]